MSRSHKSIPKTFRRIAILQPGYLPWLGFFDQMGRSDVFVYHTDVQYDKQSWRNRNRIRTKQGWTWLTAPVRIKRHSKDLIEDMRIDNSQNWRKRHCNLIKESYQKAPYFSQYFPFFKDIYSSSWEFLTDLDIYIVDYLIKALGIETKIMLSTQLNLKEKEKTERLIEICKKLGADVYFSGSAARNYIRKNRFKEEGIKLEYQDYQHPVYPQQYEPFIPYMSIIDLLFNHGKESLDIILHRKKWNGSTE